MNINCNLDEGYRMVAIEDGKRICSGKEYYIIPKNSGLWGMMEYHIGIEGSYLKFFKLLTVNKEILFKYFGEEQVFEMAITEGMTVE